MFGPGLRVVWMYSQQQVSKDSMLHHAPVVTLIDNARVCCTVNLKAEQRSSLRRSAATLSALLCCLGVGPLPEQGQRPPTYTSLVVPTHQHAHGPQEKPDALSSHLFLHRLGAALSWAGCTAEGGWGLKALAGGLPPTVPLWSLRLGLAFHDSALALAASELSRAALQSGQQTRG